MTCCPNPNIYPPVIYDCDGTLRPLGHDETLLVDGRQIPQVLTEDLDVYIAVSGNDVTGSGRVDDPFFSIHKALDYIAHIIPANFQINIHCDEGIYTLDRNIVPTHAYGGAINITGEKTNVNTTLTISNIDVSYSTDASFPNLQYFDCDIDLSGDSPSVKVGYFIRIKDATGGTNHDALRGMHEIIAWDSGTETATIRVWSKVDVAALPTGSITATNADVLQTIFKFDESIDDHALEINGFHAGKWNWVVIRGNQNMFDARRGIRCQGGGTFVAQSPCGLHNFDIGIECFNGSSVEFAAGMVSKIFTIACSTSAGSNVRLNFTAYVSGCGQSAAWCQGGGNITLGDSIVVACAETYCVLCQRGGTVEATDAFFFYEDKSPVSTACFRADSLGNIAATGVTVTDFTTTNFTATQGRIEPP